MTLKNILPRALLERIERILIVNNCNFKTEKVTLSIDGEYLDESLDISVAVSFAFSAMLQVIRTDEVMLEMKMKHVIRGDPTKAKQEFSQLFHTLRAQLQQ